MHHLDGRGRSRMDRQWCPPPHTHTFQMLFQSPPLGQPSSLLLLRLHPRQQPKALRKRCQYLHLWLHTLRDTPTYVTTLPTPIANAGPSEASQCLQCLSPAEPGEGAPWLGQVEGR